ncbi:M28 family metallopeptidase [Heliorestis convoluta]|nr:M28 family peptidase [Heliorestis convoluta]
MVIGKGKGVNPWGERPPRATVDRMSEDSIIEDKSSVETEKQSSSPLSRRNFLLGGATALGLSLTATGWYWGHHLLHGPTSDVMLPIEAMARDGKSASVSGLSGMMEHIATLSQPVYEGRLAGTAGEARAGEYIARLWERWGLEPRGEASTYFQTFPIPPLTIVEEGERARLQAVAGAMKVADNLIGFLPGRDPFLRHEVIILSAHYDHLGQWGDRLYRGANDNGSGIAILLELSRLMVQQRPRRSVAFIAFSGEEAGLFGSRHFTNAPTLSLDQVIGLINLDTVANGRTDEFIYWSSAPLPWQDTIHQVAEACQIRIRHQVTDRNSSDHRPFEEKGVPAITVLSDSWLHKNHTPEDDITLINPEKLQKITDWTYQFIYALADEGDRVGR